MVFGATTVPSSREYWTRLDDLSFVPSITSAFNKSLSWQLCVLLSGQVGTQKWALEL